MAFSFASPAAVLDFSYTPSTKRAPGALRIGRRDDPSLALRERHGGAGHRLAAVRHDARVHGRKQCSRRAERQEHQRPDGGTGDGGCGDVPMTRLMISRNATDVRSCVRLR